MNRVKAVEKERDHLEEAKNEAMEYVHKEKEVLENQSMLYQLRRAEVEAKFSSWIKKKSELDVRR